jgi:hypothetical protein
MPGTTVRAVGPAPAALRGHKLPCGVSLPFTRRRHAGEFRRYPRRKTRSPGMVHIPDWGFASPIVRSAVCLDPALVAAMCCAVRVNCARALGAARHVTRTAPGDRPINPVCRVP